MKTPLKHEIYNISKTCDENYEHGPYFEGSVPPRPLSKRKVKLFNFELNSPLGIASGPLINSKFISFYANFGFDVPVYKTVRSIYREVHPAPNCVYVDKKDQFRVGEPISDVQTAPKPQFLEDVTITNSFGVQTPHADIWMRDIEKANSLLHSGQVMPVSITGTDGAEGRSLVQDFAYTAAMAKDAGAKIIIANYSCPNVSSGEGSVYSDPEFSSEVSAAIRKAIGNTPFLIKMGWLPMSDLETVVMANRPFVDGYSGINTVPKYVKKPDGSQALPGEGRLQSGICGAAIREVGESFVLQMNEIRKKNDDDFVLVGVGGMMKAEHLMDRYNSGANIVMTATAAMWDPFLAHRFYEQWNKEN